MRGVVFDGESAAAQPVEISFTVEGADILATDGTSSLVPARLLRRSGPQRLHRTDRRDWRLLPDAPPPAEWLAGIAPLGRLDRRATWSYAGAGLLTVAVLAGLWFGGDRLLVAAAPLVPDRLLVTLGDGLVRDLGGRRCVDPAGLAALDRLQGRLVGPGKRRQVTVIETRAVNALAVPGGRIVIFQGLIDAAASPDEVAGVLAHEISHDALHHPTKALLRQMGVSLLASAIGGQMGSAADLAVLLDGSRRAETDADRGAITLLHAAGVSPRGLGDFFVRLREAEGRKPKDMTRQLLDRIGDFTATHPGDSDRAAMMAAAAARQGAVSPALGAADWQALRGICNRTAPN
ncbi:MAG: peptidase M48, Ste24p [Alphaproteobacteria bacterium]|nr:MAG: peptidase M48, Ste24p [Alphaproteobacteria bacterium]